MARLIRSLILLLVLPSLVWGATLRYSENFDDQSLDDTGVTAKFVPRLYGKVAEAGEYSWGTGHGVGSANGSGYSFGSGTVNGPWLEWGGFYAGGAIGTWYTDELYVSFWMRYPTYTHTDPNENVKFFYPQFGPNNDDKVEYVLYNDQMGWYLMAAYDNGAEIPGQDGGTAEGMTDGTWHHYEFYLNFATSINRFWYDGVLKEDANYTDGIWTNSVNLITVGAMDAEEPGTFTRFFDDVEIWDGMPDETPAPAPPTLSNVTISNGSFR